MDKVKFLSDERRSCIVETVRSKPRQRLVNVQSQTSRTLAFIYVQLVELTKDCGNTLQNNVVNPDYFLALKSKLEKILYETEAACRPPPIPPVKTDFDIVKPIGRGTFGNVFLVRHKKTRQAFAMKQIKVKSKYERDFVLLERDILTFLDSPLVISLFCSFETKKHLYMVMEYVGGGDVETLLAYNHHFSLTTSRFYIAEVVLALEYIHSYGIIHRDLKPNNLLLTTTGHIKVADFGLAKFGSMNMTRSPTESDCQQIAKEFTDGETCGTPLFTAPEVFLQTGYGKPMDWWSTGTILYNFLYGFAPFEYASTHSLSRHVIQDDLFCPDVNPPLPPDVQSFISLLLDKNCVTRLGTRGADEVKGHPFFKDVDWNNLLYQTPPFIPELDNEEDTRGFQTYGLSTDDGDDEDDSPAETTDFCCVAFRFKETHKTCIPTVDVKSSEDNFKLSIIKDFGLGKLEPILEEDSCEVTDDDFVEVDLNFQCDPTPSPPPHHTFPTQMGPVQECLSDDLPMVEWLLTIIELRMAELANDCGNILQDNLVSPNFFVRLESKLEEILHKIRNSSSLNMDVEPSEDPIKLIMTAHLEQFSDDDLLLATRALKFIEVQLLKLSTDCENMQENKLFSRNYFEDLENKLEKILHETRAVCKPPPIQPVKTDFDIVKPISCGAFGNVFLVRHKKTRQAFALKQIKVKSKYERDFVLLERDILTFLDSPLVISMFCSFETKKHLYMVMEYVGGGDLETLLAYNHHFSLTVSRFYIAEVVLALEYIHSYGIIHRDLKPNNLLLTTTGHIKVADFGLAKFGSMNMTRSPTESDCLLNAKEFTDGETCGTPLFTAPEVFLQTGYGKPMDWWSTGTILYNFLYGFAPFEYGPAQNLRTRVIKDELVWPDPEHPPPPDVQSFISLLLDKNCVTRLGTRGADEVKGHPFFKDVDWNNLLYQTPPFIPELDNEEDTRGFQTYGLSTDDGDDEDDSPAETTDFCCVAFRFKETHKTCIPTVDPTPSPPPHHTFPTQMGPVQECLSDDLPNVEWLLTIIELRIAELANDCSNMLQYNLVSPNFFVRLESKLEEILHKIRNSSSLNMDVEPSEDLINLIMTAHLEQFSDDDLLLATRALKFIEVQLLKLSTDCENMQENKLFSRSYFVDLENKLEKILHETRAVCKPPLIQPAKTDFDIVKPLGRGAFGNVFLVRHKNTRQAFAMKQIKVKSKYERDFVLLERDILTFLDSPLVISLFCSFETKKHLYMVMEYVGGGDVETLLAYNHHFSLTASRFYIAEVVLALEYIHSYGIIHRDLKPNNLLLTTAGHIKVADFGLAKFGSMNMTRSPTESDCLLNAKEFTDGETCGTPLFTAPEVFLQTGYGKPMDWWSTGTILYNFLYGFAPFEYGPAQNLRTRVIQDELVWPDPEHPPPPDVQSFISLLLDKNCVTRLGTRGAKEVKGHPFFKDVDWNNLLYQMPPFIPELDNEEDTRGFQTYGLSTDDGDDEDDSPAETTDFCCVAFRFKETHKTCIPTVDVKSSEDNFKLSIIKDFGLGKLEPILEEDSCEVTDDDFVEVDLNFQCDPTPSPPPHHTFPTQMGPVQECLSDDLPMVEWLLTIIELRMAELANDCGNILQDNLVSPNFFVRLESKLEEILHKIRNSSSLNMDVEPSEDPIKLIMTAHLEQFSDDDLLLATRALKFIEVQLLKLSTDCENMQENKLFSRSYFVDLENKLEKILHETRAVCKPPPIQPVKTDFDIVKPLGRGAFGNVFLVRHKKTRQAFALKQITVKSKYERDFVLLERDILTFLDSPLVISLFCSFETKKHLYMVMEYVGGGDLETLLAYNHHFSLTVSRFYIAEVVLALEYIHSYGIIHRDLKPNNLLLTTTGHIKVADFGLAKFGSMNMMGSLTESDCLLNAKEFTDGETCGTPLFTAPEVFLQTGYGKPMDWWSTGTILYNFLYGFAPFEYGPGQNLRTRVIQDELVWPDPEHPPPPDVQSFISLLLDKNCVTRLGTRGAKEVKGHPFFKDVDWNNLLYQTPPFIPELDNEEDTRGFQTYGLSTDDGDDEDDSPAETKDFCCVAFRFKEQYGSPLPLSPCKLMNQQVKKTDESFLEVDSTTSPPTHHISKVQMDPEQDCTNDDKLKATSAFRPICFQLVELTSDCVNTLQNNLVSPNYLLELKSKLEDILDKTCKACS